MENNQKQSKSTGKSKKIFLTVVVVVVLLIGIIFTVKMIKNNQVQVTLIDSKTQKEIQTTNEEKVEEKEDDLEEMYEEDNEEEVEYVSGQDRKEGIGERKEIGDFEVWIERLEKNDEKYLGDLGNHEESFVIHLKVQNMNLEENVNFSDRYEFVVAASTPGEVYEYPNPYPHEEITEDIEEVRLGETIYTVLAYVVPRNSERLVLKVRLKGDQEYMHENIEFNVHNSLWEEFSHDMLIPPINTEDLWDKYNE